MVGAVGTLGTLPGRRLVWGGNEAGGKIQLSVKVN